MNWFISNPMQPFRQPVHSQYGAPMGRRSDQPGEFVGKANLQRVPFVDGDYDPGGAYWGGGRGSQPLFCAWDDEGHRIYLRASSRNEAKTILSAKGIRFKR